MKRVDIADLATEAERLLATEPRPDGLFSPHVDYQPAATFFRDLEEALAEEESLTGYRKSATLEFMDGRSLTERVEGVSRLTGGVVAIFRVLNEPKSDVRNGLILFGLAKAHAKDA